MKKLRANSHFGELALLNEEPRSATITVISETAKCLKMTKTKFDEIIAVTKMFNAGSRTVIADGATDKVPLFKTLSAATRVKLLENMGDIVFSPGSYICRQVGINDKCYCNHIGEIDYNQNGTLSLLSFQLLSLVINHLLT